ncbi:hypothetical protein [Staphylococcus hominis]|uniref:hypothetical protein n=1 Tax=Staphylococcus hominis TaxID=1290 RepID=UPI0018871D8B|nr:hypothetical protein [Staphylococcus hominis]MBF2307757.1 hypothetical protein [Staphylococcus hominis]MBF2316769.1 hypothetical protein [Staphylococcus hominis]MBF2321055.1 hypothetical protein [Staphylococcus hominis]
MKNINKFLCKWNGIIILVLALTFAYVTWVYAFKRVIDISLEDSLSIFKSLTSLLGIIITAIVAIYTMKSNQKHNIKIEKEKEKKQDEAKMYKIDIYLNQILSYSKDFAFKIYTTNDIQSISINAIQDYIDKMLDYVELAKGYEMINITEEYTNALKTLDFISTDLDNVKLKLTLDGVLVNPSEFRKHFYNIYSVTYDYLNTERSLVNIDFSKREF